MRSISARQFRATFADLAEPVEVLRRDADGNFQVLGEWRPASNGNPSASFGRPSPAPKPAPRKRS